MASIGFSLGQPMGRLTAADMGTPDYVTALSKGLELGNKPAKLSADLLSAHLSNTINRAKAKYAEPLAEAQLKHLQQSMSQSEEAARLKRENPFLGSGGAAGSLGILLYLRQHPEIAAKFGGNGGGMQSQEQPSIPDMSPQENESYIPNALGGQQQQQTQPQAQLQGNNANPFSNFQMPSQGNQGSLNPMDMLTQNIMESLRPKETPEQKTQKERDMYLWKQQNKSGSSLSDPTTAFKTKNQTAIQATDALLPMVDKLINTSVPGTVESWFNPSGAANYKDITAGMMDTLLTAYGLTSTKENTELMSRKIEKRTGESDAAYKKRLKTNLKEELYQRKRLSKKSLNMPLTHEDYTDDELEKLSRGEKL